jgi:hypothetical protein
MTRWEEAEREVPKGRWTLTAVTRRQKDGQVESLSDSFRERPTVADLAYLLNHLDPNADVISVRADWRA